MKNSKQYIRIIQNSGHQLLRIVDDLIEISSLETKQLVASEQPFCFNEMLFDLFTVFDLRAKENTKLLRGEISVKSKKGKGTTFFVDIPYKPLKTSKSKKLIKSSEIKKESA